MAEEAVHRMPYEGYETSVDAAAKDLVGLLDSDEDTPGEPPAQEAEAEEVEAEADEIEEDFEEEADEQDEDADDEEEAEEVEEEPQPQKFTVKVDGAEQEVTLDELLAGYSRTADYTRKTQAVAEERKALAAEAEQARTAREKYAATVEQLEQVLVANQPAEPDWARLRQEDPAEYAAQREDWRKRQEDLAAVRAERERLQAEQMAEAQEELRKHLAAESEKLTEAFPEWKDEAKAREAKRALSSYATGLGFTEAELGQVYDHRLLVMLDKARRFDELQARGQETLAEKKVTAKVLKPGSRDVSPNRGKKTRTRDADRRLRQTGRAEDAAAWILEAGILDD